MVRPRTTQKRKGKKRREGREEMRGRREEMRGDERR